MYLFNLIELPCMTLIHQYIYICIYISIAFWYYNMYLKMILSNISCRIWISGNICISIYYCAYNKCVLIMCCVICFNSVRQRELVLHQYLMAWCKCDWWVCTWYTLMMQSAWGIKLFPLKTERLNGYFVEYDPCCGRNATSPVRVRTLLDRQRPSSGQPGGVP